MALSVIIVLYVCVGILAAAGSIFISQKLFSAKAEQIFFALFFIAIAAFYLAFTAYFGDQRAWRLECGLEGAFPLRAHIRHCEVMTRLAVTLFLTSLLPHLASAKRISPLK